MSTDSTSAPPPSTPNQATTTTSSTGTPSTTTQQSSDHLHHRQLHLHLFPPLNSSCRLSISSLQRHRLSQLFSSYLHNHCFRLVLNLSHCSRVILLNLMGSPLQLQLSSPSYQLYPLQQRLFLHLFFLL